MHTNNTFSLQRQQQVMFRQFSLQQNRILLYAAAIFGIYLLVNLAIAFIEPAAIGRTSTAFIVIMILGGYFFTSQILNELNSRQQSYALLTLPASPLEKLLAAWFISGPVFVLLVGLGGYLITLIGYLAAGAPLTEVNFLNQNFWEKIGDYLVVQPIFLWGAAYFRSYNFLKTILSSVVLGIALFVYVILLQRGSMLWADVEHTHISSTGLPAWLKQLNDVFLYIVLPPYMLLVTYFTIKERQV